jgi:hypothetical protein
MPEPRRLHITSVIFLSKWKNEFDQFARKEIGHTASALICTRELDQKKEGKKLLTFLKIESIPGRNSARSASRGRTRKHENDRKALPSTTHSQQGRAHTHTHKSAHRIEGPFHDGHWAIGQYTHKCRSQKSGPWNVHTAGFELEPELSVWFQVLRRTSSSPPRTSGHSEPAATSARWRMNGKWSGNSFLLGFS